MILDRLMGWLLIVVGALALAVSREQEIFAIALGILAAGPFIAWISGMRVPRWSISLGLSAVAYTLPWPMAERMTLIFAMPVLQSHVSEAIRLTAAGAALVIVAGQSKLTPMFVALAAAWVLAVMLWLALRQRAQRARRGALRPWRAMDWVWIGAHVSLTVAFAAATAHGLPGVERWFVERAMNLTLERQSGFSTRTDLNGVESIRTSSKIALRIHDPGPYLLRGQVYGTYRMGVWTSARQGTFPLVAPAAAAELGKPIRIQSAMDSNMIAFAPLEWATMESSSPLAQDNCRVVTTREASREWTFRPVRSLRSSAPLPDEERQTYTLVPPEVEQGLRPLVASVLKPGLNDRQKVQAFLYYLNEACEYSLEPGAPKGEEPIVRFLTRTKKGHCEYFAASLALLCRVAGVPSRYATGYAATERNSFGGYLMARDSDAHAWTEVWIPGEGWTVWDATPSVWMQLTENKSSKLGELARELWDYLMERWETLWERFSNGVLRPLGAWLKSLGHRALPLGLAALALVLAGLWYRPLVRRLRALLAWLASRLRKEPVAEVAPELRAAAGSLEAFEALVAPLGVLRGKSTTPHELGRRLDAMNLPEDARAAALELMDHFCRFRYGGAAWDAGRAAACLERLRANLTAAGPAR